MDVEALISSVFIKNPLWDQKDTQHHNRFILDKLWDAVADEMKSTRNIVRTKWKNLRDSFRKELKKMPVKRSGDGACNWKSSWPYFDSLYFLKDQFTARPGSGNLPNAEHENILDEDINSQLSESNTQTLDDSINVDKSPLVNTSLQNNSSELNASTSTPAAKKFKRKQQTDSDVGAALIRLEEEKLQILEKHHKQSPDEDDSFFQSLLPHIRTLAPQRKMLLRMKMQQLVYNFDYGTNQDYVSQRTGNMHIYETNGSQLIQLQPTMQEYSNPASARSYLSNFSEESLQNM